MYYIILSTYPIHQLHDMLSGSSIYNTRGGGYSSTFAGLVPRCVTVRSIERGVISHLHHGKKMRALFAIVCILSPSLMAYTRRHCLTVLNRYSTASAVTEMRCLLTNLVSLSR